MGLLTVYVPVSGAFEVGVVQDVIRLRCWKFHLAMRPLVAFWKLNVELILALLYISTCHYLHNSAEVAHLFVVKPVMRLELYRSRWSACNEKGDRQIVRGEAIRSAMV